MAAGLDAWFRRDGGGYLKEERLTKEVRELRIEIDEARQNRQVAEITESEFYRNLTAEAEVLRGIIGNPDINGE